MAAYQGARTRVAPPLLRPGVPARHARRAALPVERRPLRITARAQRRVRPTAAVLAVIVGALLLGLVHLTYTLQAAAVRHGTGVLLEERARLMREIQSQEGIIAFWSSESQVMEWAQQHGLDRLGGTLRVPSR